MANRPSPPYFDNLADSDGKASKLWLNYFQSLGNSSSGVNSVSGVTGEITITGTTADPIVGISSAYHGSSNITHLGTITTGVWSGSVIGSAYLPSGFAGLANPTAQIGLTAVNGTSANALRSDGAPALSQAIAPTWTALHTFNLAPKVAAFAGGGTLLVTTDTTGQLGTTAFPATVTGANPTASVGLTAVNGSASTFMRSDAAPPISQAISPTWSGTHTFSNTIVGSVNGNAATVTTNANLTGPITSVGNATSIASQTGTGTTFAMSAGPTFTGTITAANQTISGTLGVTGVATFTAQPVVSSLSAFQAVFSDGFQGLVSNPITGSGNVMMSASPTTTGTLTAAIANFSGQVTGTKSGYGINAAFMANTSTYSAYGFKDNTAGTDSKVWHIIANAGQMRFSALNDANSGGTDFIIVNRSGITVSDVTFGSQIIGSTLSASSAVATDASKGLISVTNTGTGNNVLSASPTLTGTALATNLTVSGALTGTLTGSITGNAATATALQTARAINGVNFDGTAPITITAAAGTLTGATLNSSVLASSLTSVGTLAALTVTATITGAITGNAGTATTFATARAINGVNFDGSTAITIAAAAGTLTGATLAAGVTTSSLTSVGTLATLTVTAAIAGSITGNAATVTTNANLTGPITSVGNATSIASQTGTGTTFAMSVSPTFTGTINSSVLNVASTLTVANTGVNSIVGPLHIGSVSTASRAFRVAGIALSGDNQVGALITPKFASDSLTSATTILAGFSTLAAAFTVVNGYGIYIDTPALGAGSAVTTAYGLFINDQSGGGTNYAIKTGTGLVSFGGAVTAVTTLGVTGVATFTAQPILSSLSASQAVFTDSSKGLVSNAITGSGNVAMSASPTFTGTITAAAATLSSTLTVTNTGVNNIAGPLHLGGASSAARAFRIAGITLSGDNQFGALISPTFTSASTTTGSTMDLTLTTAASSFTMATGYCLRIESQSIGSGSAITVSHGLKIEDQSGATTNNAIVTGKGFVNFGDIVTLSHATFSNAAYTFPTPASGTAGVQYAGQTGTMSASRVVTLPPASSYPRGTLIAVADESGTTSAVNTIVITRAGSDTINGATTKTIGITGGYDVWVGMSDGVSKWVTITSI